MKKHTHLLRKIFGAIIIVSAMVAGFTGTSAAWVVNNASSSADVTAASENNNLFDPLSSPYAAPALNSNTTWLNSPPLTMESLKGKVVLIDFWTYSCINCIRTLPYLKNWYAQYHDKGLVIIGVHAPEFEFEKNVSNVKQAIKQYDIRYPVVRDNKYAIWQNYHNQYWPAHYLIDKNGQVVYQHFGEGKYDETEHNIRVLLGLTGDVNTPPEKLASNFAQTPETYLGYERADNYAGAPKLLPDQPATYELPTTLPQDAWALAGKWLIQPEKITSLNAHTTVKIHFYASHVYVVMGSTHNQPINVSILLNGKPLKTKSSFVVDRHNLYPVLNFPEAMEGELTLQFDQPGAEVYTFTFG